MSMIDNIHVGSIIQQLLREKGLTTVDLSKLSGISASTLYSLIDRDDPSLSLSNFLKICKALNVAPEYFWETADVQIPIGLGNDIGNDLLTAYAKADPNDQHIIRYILRKYVASDSTLYKADQRLSNNNHAD